MSKIIITHYKIFPKKLEKLTLQMSNLLVNNYHWTFHFNRNKRIFNNNMDSLFFRSVEKFTPELW